jgi:hypothetical protein
VIYTECTGRPYVRRAYAEATVIAGARSGKDSRFAAVVVLYEALFGPFPVGTGESVLAALIAQDARAAKIAFRYIRGYLKGSPGLHDRLVKDTESTLLLDTGIQVQCFPSTVASLQGWSICIGVMDEPCPSGKGASTPLDQVRTDRQGRARCRGRPRPASAQRVGLARASSSASVAS